MGAGREPSIIPNPGEGAASPPPSGDSIMGDLLKFPRQELDTPFPFHLPDFGPSGDEIGAIVIGPAGTDAPPLFVIYFPTSKEEINWEDEIESKWQNQLKVALKEVINEGGDSIFKRQAVLLIWNPIFKEEDNTLMGGNDFEIIWPGVLTEKMQLFLRTYLDLKYSKKK